MFTYFFRFLATFNEHFFPQAQDSQSWVKGQQLSHTL